MIMCAAPLLNLQNLLNLFMKEDLTMYKIQVYIP